MWLFLCRLECHMKWNASKMCVPQTLFEVKLWVLAMCVSHEMEMQVKCGYLDLSLRYTRKYSRNYLWSVPYIQLNTIQHYYCVCRELAHFHDKDHKLENLKDFFLKCNRSQMDFGYYHCHNLSVDVHTPSKQNRYFILYA